jgi:hypothetical protein
LKVDHDDVHIGGWCRFHYRRNQHNWIAELNQELFDKLFWRRAVASIDELKAKIKEMLKLNLQHKQTKIIRRCYWVLNRKHKIRFTNFLKNGYKL